MPSRLSEMPELLYENPLHISTQFIYIVRYWPRITQAICYLHERNKSHTVDVFPDQIRDGKGQVLGTC